MTNNIIHIADELYDEAIETFIKAFNAVDLQKPVTIYLDSPGGYTTHASIIIDLINKHKDNITLIASGAIYSAAFDIFFQSECKRIILSNEVTGMTHFGWNTFDVSETGKTKNEHDKFMMNKLKSKKVATLETLKKLGLNTKELQIVRNNKDCYFTTQRLKELLNGQIKDN